MANEYDVVVIGAGTGGYPTAIRAAQLGMRVAVVEKQKALGGTCLIWGCIPTKALLEHAHALKVAQGAKEWGLSIDGASVRIDMKQVQARKDKVVTTLTKGVEYLFRKNKIDWIKGTARLLGNGTVEVSGEQPQTLHAKKEIVVATGSRPQGVPGVEIDRRRIITSDEAIGLQDVPKSIAILGAGAVGVEFGSIFRSYGSAVTIVELLPRLVPVEDEAVSAELQRAFKKRGIKTHAGSKVTRVVSTADGVDLDVQLPDGAIENLKADYLLVATGRGPVTDGLGAAEIGLQIDRGYIVVDEFYRTGVPGVSAVGDVISFGRPGHPQLAHVASHEGIVAVEHVAGQPPRKLNYDQIPVHLLPSRGRHHRTRARPRDRGHDVAVGTFPFTAIGKAKILNDTGGFVKIVAEKKYDEILGVHIIGPHATELIAEATAALNLEATAESLFHAIHAHPTLSEAMGEAAQRSRPRDSCEADGDATAASGRSRQPRPE